MSHENFNTLDNHEKIFEMIDKDEEETDNDSVCVQI